VVGVRAVFEHHVGVIPRDFATWLCSDPVPTVDEVLAKLAALNPPQPAELRAHAEAVELDHQA
jgi:hypothetical protein